MFFVALAEYMAEERKLREQYKTEMTEWRKKCAEQKKVEREEREIAALQAAEAGQTMEPDHHGHTPPHEGSMDNKWMGMQQPQAPPKADGGKATSLLDALQIAWQYDEIVWDEYQPHRGVSRFQASP